MKFKTGFTLAEGGIFVVRSKLCLRRHANVKGARNGKISDKKFCNGVTSPEPLENSKTGFTLAEVLLTLAVIGIVAAITLPSLLVDTTEKAFDAQKRALHARLTQAIGMMSTLSGYGQYAEESKAEDDTVIPKKDDAAETFLYEGLSKVYKMNNICDSDNLDKCGIPTSITKMNGDTMNFPKKISELNPLLVSIYFGSTTDTKAAGFETVNGESIAVFYNPNCKNDIDLANGAYYLPQNRMCANFVYDLNGAKGPNKVGRDIGFITALYAKNSEVAAPIPFETDIDSTSHTHQEAVELCANFSDDSRLPNKHELRSMFYNMDLIGNLGNEHYWASSVSSPDFAYGVNNANGGTFNYARTSKNFVRCVKK